MELQKKNLSDAEVEAAFEASRNAPPSFPNGQLGEHDYGAFSMALAADREKKVVYLRFDRPISWTAFDVTSLRNLIAVLAIKLEELEKP